MDESGFDGYQDTKDLRMFTIKHRDYIKYLNWDSVATTVCKCLGTEEISCWIFGRGTVFHVAEFCSHVVSSLRDRALSCLCGCRDSGQWKCCWARDRSRHTVLPVLPVRLMIASVQYWFSILPIASFLQIQNLLMILCRVDEEIFSLHNFRWRNIILKLLHTMLFLFSATCFLNMFSL